MKTQIKNHVKDFDGFVNEQKLNESFDELEILTKNGIEIGGIVRDIPELMKGATYCLLDQGDGLWRYGYEYTGKKGSKYVFKNVELGDPGDKPEIFSYSEREMEDMFNSMVWAEQAWE